MEQQPKKQRDIRKRLGEPNTRPPAGKFLQIIALQQLSIVETFRVRRANSSCIIKD
jgi:hypothetical protein